jgi:hypothetical protein
VPGLEGARIYTVEVKTQKEVGGSRSWEGDKKSKAWVKDGWKSLS